MKQNFILTLGLALFWISAGNLKGDEPRRWIDKKGRPLDATLLDFDGETIALKRTDGDVFRIPINTLSEEDIDYVEQRYAWVPVAAIDLESEEAENWPTPPQFFSRLEQPAVEFNFIEPIGYERRKLATCPIRPYGLAVNNNGDIALTPWPLKKGEAKGPEQFLILFPRGKMMEKAVELSPPHKVGEEAVARFGRGIFFDADGRLHFAAYFRKEAEAQDLDEMKAALYRLDKGRVEFVHDEIHGVSYGWQWVEQSNSLIVTEGRPIAELASLEELKGYSSLSTTPKYRLALPPLAMLQDRYIIAGNVRSEHETYRLLYDTKSKTLSLFGNVPFAALAVSPDGSRIVHWDPTDQSLYEMKIALP